MPETAEVTPAKTEPQATNPPSGARPESKVEPRKKSGIKEHPIKFAIFLLFLVGAAYGGYHLWQYLDSFEDTDDAQIDGDIYAVTSRVAGQIKGVYVQDNQAVKAGQLLVELDPKDYEIAVEQAKASLNESRTNVAVAQPSVPLASVQTQTTVSTATTDIEGAQAGVAAAQRELESAQANVRKAEADSVKAQADLARYRLLVAKDEISKQQFDQAQAAANAAAADVEAKRAIAASDTQKIQQEQAKVTNAQTRQSEAQRTSSQQVAIQSAIVANRQATSAHQQTLVDQAMLNLTYTKIFAPVDGIIGRKNAEPGQQVAPGQQLMADVPVSDVWVTANFKETQLKKMHAGQKATLHVDAFDRDYEGFVESTSAASGARFSLLPPENATGNYVKVVQRLPVRIRFKEGQDPNHLLRPGMSVEPKVWLNQ